MDIYTRFRQALNTDEPMWRLREEVQRLLAEGYDRNVLVAQLELCRQHLSEAGCDASASIPADHRALNGTVTIRSSEYQLWVWERYTDRPVSAGAATR